MAEPWTRWIGGEGARPLDPAARRNVFVIAHLSEEGAPGGPWVVDRDDLDGLLARLAPRIDFATEEIGKVALESWFDFTPAGIVAQSPGFGALLRGSAPRANPAEPPGSLGAQASDGAALLDEILGGRGAPGPSARRPSRDEIDEAIQAIVDATPSAPRESPEARAQIEADVSRRLRVALSHPGFGSLEAGWLSLRRMVSALECGPALRIQAVNATRANLAQAAAALAALEMPAGEAAGLIVACFAIGDEPEDRALGAALRVAGERLGCPVLADASPDLFERACAGTLAGDPVWREMQAAVGDRVRLVAPRVLARAPYDRESEGAEGLGFETAQAEDARWMAGAVLAAEMWVSGVRRLEWLPSVAARAGSGLVQVGPAERIVSEREIASATAAQLVTLAGARGEDWLVAYGLD